MSKKRIGITGQQGFVGSHLYNTLSLDQENYELVPFKRSYFSNSSQLDGFVSSCDVIVHLAAMNRHEDQQVIYNTNKELVASLISALERTKSTPHILFSSSTQEERDTPYGQSKKEGRELLESWAQRSGGKCSGLVIPNVFGPFGKPFYNSVVATFCHQVALGDQPQIQIDAELSLLYVGELVGEFINCIENQVYGRVDVGAPHRIKVSEILELLEGYRDNYLEKGIIPTIANDFEHHLFNTFRCFLPIKDYFPRYFTKHADNRGHFVELARLGIAGQMSFSTTHPGITRGNHFHTRKIERFAVIQGKARIQLRRYGTDEVMNYYLDGKDPSYVDMPIWHTHNITNIGEDELITVFWINEPYDAEDPDTYFVKVEPQNEKA